MTTPTEIPMSQAFDPVWRRETSRRIRAVARSDALYALLEPWGCGPFDGGCVLFAEALQLAFGLGQLQGLMGYGHEEPPTTEPRWQHAVVILADDTYADADGLSTARTLRRRWRTQELTIVRRIEPMAPKAQWPICYPDPAYDEAVVAQIAALLR
jgi:hypothetical protein